jgi:hypothetical protein
MLADVMVLNSAYDLHHVSVVGSSLATCRPVGGYVCPYTSSRCCTQGAALPPSWCVCAECSFVKLSGYEVGRLFIAQA